MSPYLSFARNFTVNRIAMNLTHNLSRTCDSGQRILTGLRDRSAAAWPWVRDALLAVALIISLTLFAGCAPFPKVDVREPTSARPLPPQRTVQLNGAIYQQAAFRPLFEDNRARFVGDILTININENLSATQEKKSSTSKTGTVTAANPDVKLPIGAGRPGLPWSWGLRSQRP